MSVPPEASWEIRTKRRPDPPFSMMSRDRSSSFQEGNASRVRHSISSSFIPKTGSPPNHGSGGGKVLFAWNGGGDRLFGRDYSEGTGYPYSGGTGYLSWRDRLSRLGEGVFGRDRLFVV